MTGFAAMADLWRRVRNRSMTSCRRGADGLAVCPIVKESACGAGRRQDRPPHDHTWLNNCSRLLTLAVLMATTLFADSVDRSVAEWTLTMGGRVGLAGQTRRISDIADLPPGDIQLEG